MTDQHNAVNNYSLLESLLLFQSIVAAKHQKDAFKNISDALRRSTLLQQHSPNPSDSGERFQPEALQNFYLQLLKDEAAKQETHATLNGDVDVGEGLTVDEDRQQLACEVVDKLYARYKDQVIQEIKDEERRYDTLSKELCELEEGAAETAAAGEGVVAAAETKAEADIEEKQTLEEETAQIPSLNQTSPAIPSIRKSSPEELFSVGETKTDSPLPLRPSPSPENPLETTKQDGKTSDSSTISDERSATPTANQPRTSTPSSLIQDQLAAAMAHVPTQAVRPSPLESLPSLHPTPTRSPASRASRSPVLKSQQTINTPTIPATTSAASTFSSLPRRPSTQGTSPPSTHLSQYNQPAQTTPTQQDAHAQHQASSSRKSPSQSNVSASKAGDIRRYITQTPGRYPHPGASLLPSGSSHPPHSHVQPSTSGLPQSQPQHTYSRGGVVLPPFQVNPQAPVISHNTSSEPRHRSHGNSPVNQSVPTPALAIPQDSVTRVIESLASYNSPNTSATATPVNNRINILSNRTSSIHVSPGSATRWKVVPSATSTVTNKTSESLRPRSISPISDTEAKSRQESKKPQGRPSSNKQQSLLKSTSATPKLALNRRYTKSRMPTRTASQTPSAIVGSGSPRSRSGSVASHADELSLTTESSALPRFKLDSIEGDRHLRPTKRKRSSASHYESTLRQHNLPAPIVAVRNFSRATNPVMNTINSHKHASTFAHPVKERDAEGYTDIIRRPQDLKSIRAAIATGSRAVHAAQTAESLLNSPGGEAGATSGTVQLPYSPDLVPPKGIVNGAQLEQEVMRMFANAVMFNPGNEGVVQDTREMFETVEGTITSWRSLEQAPTNIATGSDGGGSSSSLAAVAATSAGTAKEEDEEADELAADSAVATPTVATGSVRKRHA